MEHDTLTHAAETPYTFTRAYIECALWSTLDDDGEQLGSDSDLADSARAQMIQDCLDFKETHSELLARWYSECSESPDRAGHDFWLTRNHHGAGFWDRWSGGTPQSKIGAALTEAAHACGSCDLYVGDDGLIYCQ